MAMMKSTTNNMKKCSLLLSLVFSLLTISVTAQEQKQSQDERRLDDDFMGSPQYALIYPWIIQVIGVIASFVLHRYEWPLPYAAVMFVAGMCMGIGAYRLEGDADDQLYASIRMWSDIDAQILLLVFLPGLIFRDAIEINVHVFRKALLQLWIFAFPMVLVGTVLTAAAAMYILPQEFSWSLALTMGSILASTDPVAVASVLKAADAPPRLQMHIGGESMLNDGAAVVFYLIFSQQFLAELDLPSGSTVTIAEGIALFFRMSLGGVAVGLAFGIGLLLLLYKLDQRLEKENNILQIAAAVSAAYLSYYTSEQVCNMSGVIACVTCGICAKAWGSGLIADPDLMDSYLKLLEHFLNTLLFALGGTVFGEVVANSAKRAPFTATEWGSLFLLYAAIMVIRGIQVLIFYPVVSNIGLKTNWKEMSFFGACGIRGAVGIALALSLDRTVRQETNDEEQRAITSTVVGLAGGVSLLTLMINGTLAGWMLRQLGLTPPKTLRKRARRMFENSAREVVLHTFCKLQQKQPRFASVHFNYIRDHLPFLSNVDTDDLEQLNQNATATSFHVRRTSKIGIDDEQPSDRRLRSLSQTAADFKSLTACPDAVKNDIREIFLKTLDSAYIAELAHGGLDSREDNGFNAEVLRQSVVFAVEDCHHKDGTLQDWDYTNMFSFYDGAEVYVERAFAWLGHRFRGAKANTDVGCTQEFTKLRIRVLRALVFIEAHRRAEMEMSSYLDSIGGLKDLSSTIGIPSLHLENAIHAVLEESETQVQAAEDWLASDVSAESLQTIRGHYMVTILLHKLGLYVEKSVTDGRLKEKEGRVYLQQIDQRVHKVHECSRDHQDAPAPRRRRQKQNSAASTTSSVMDNFFRGP